jgi:hypothetical protein
MLLHQPAKMNLITHTNFLTNFVLIFLYVCNMPLKISTFEYRTGECIGEAKPMDGIFGIPLEKHKTKDDKMFFRFEDDTWKIMSEFNPDDIDYWRAVK